MYFLSSPIWSNGQTASIFVSTWVFISSHFHFNNFPFGLKARKAIPLVIMHILYLSHPFLSWGTTQLLPERFKRAVLRGAGVISNPHAKCWGLFILVTFAWFLYTWEIFLCLPLTIPLIFLSIYSIVSTTLHNHGHSTKPDHPNFKSLMSHYNSNATFLLP